jgi:hypothetical protein
MEGVKEGAEDVSQSIYLFIMSAAGSYPRVILYLRFWTSP